MVPDIKVPANFGRQHIGSPSHDNLVLKLKDTQKIRANSMILSLNSPVIDKLTTELHQTSLDMDDFHGDAVNCFIECCYIGELESVQKCTFRDVNKMAHVFEVSWLVSRCAGYFGDVVDNIELEGDTWYNEVLYVFEEARYMYNTLKKENFLRLVTRKVEPTKDEFARSYMKKFDDLSKDQLWLMIELVGNNVEILVDIFVKYCEVNLVMKLDENTKYFVNSMNLSCCYQHDPSLYNKLFDTLEAMPSLLNEDLRMVLTLSRKITTNITLAISNTGIVESRKSIVISNMFHTLQHLNKATTATVCNFKQIVWMLNSLPHIKNLYMFFDALHSLLELFENCLSGFDDYDIHGMEDLAQSFGWNPISKKYVSQISRTCDNHNLLIDRFLLSNVLISDEGLPEAICKGSRITAENLFTKENKWTFYFKEPIKQSCGKDGKCGFVICVSPGGVTTSSSDDNGFNIKLSYNSSDYPNDVHIHEDLVIADNIHLAIRALWDDDQKWYIFPITWAGKPSITMGRKVWWSTRFDFDEEVSIGAYIIKNNFYKKV